MKQHFANTHKVKTLTLKTTKCGNTIKQVITIAAAKVG